MTKTFCDYCGQQVTNRNFVGSTGSHEVSAEISTESGGFKRLRLALQISFPGLPAGRKDDLCFDCLDAALKGGVRRGGA